MGTHSFRNFRVADEFINDYKKCKLKQPSEKGQCERAVRSRYRDVENGRLDVMGNKIHDFVSRLDEDEVQTFKKKFPDTMKIANEFAVVEDLREF